MPIAQLFPTPVAMYDIPGMDAINREVTEILVAESRAAPTLQRSNVGSWHSQTNLQTRKEACFRTLMATITQRIRETTETLAMEAGRKLPQMASSIHSWSMVMSDGHYTIAHDHSEVHWASVYYTDVGDADVAEFPESGAIVFVDPRHGGRPIPGLDICGGNFIATPKTSRMFVFPGWLLHYVHSYRGKRPRVCVATNLTYDVSAIPPR